MSGEASSVDRIRQIHGSAVANELIEVKASSEQWGFSAEGWVSNANYNVKRTILLLFINHRAVESTVIKKAVEQTYSMFLPKGGHPFIYLSLEIDPKRVDVNVHPTKREVHFLNEDEVIDVVCEEIRVRLGKVDTTRTFTTQTLLPGVKVPTISPSSVNPPVRPPGTQNQNVAGFTDSSANPIPNPRPPVTIKPYENNLVRTDSRSRKITSMFKSTNTTQKEARDSSDHSSLEKNANSDDLNPGGKGNYGSASKEGSVEYTYVDREPIVCRLGSIKDLRSSVREATHNDLTDVVATHTFVGVVDHARRLAAIQSRTKLFLVDYGLFTFEFFYQLGLTDFGNFGLIRLDPPLSLQSILNFAASIEKEKAASADEMSVDGEDIDWTEVCARVMEQLVSRREMIAEYFSLEISADGDLLSLPLLLKGYMPSLAKLPEFLLRLGPLVEWNDEKECFRTFLKELASWYVPEALPSSALPQADSAQNAIATEQPVISARRDEISQALENVLFPAFKSRLIATKSMLNGAVEVANLRGLYRVFERC